MEELHCEFCGEEFEEGEGVGDTYCSEDCAENDEIFDDMHDDSDE